MAQAKAKANAMAKSLRLGIDVGGTFTDFALIDDSTGVLVTHKQLTSADDPSTAVLSGIDYLLAEHGLSITDVGTIVHGTTLITNAVIERKGATIGLLTTDGFVDVLDVGMESRYNLFDLRIGFADPVVPRRLRRGVAERLDHRGEVQLALDEHAVTSAVRELVEDGAIEALAICFLHSYTNPIHELQAARIASKLYPQLPISTSAEVVPVMREFERWTTTTVNAYTQPLAGRYLARLETELNKRGFGGAFLIMASNGGAVTVAHARKFPVRLIESGPAAGAIMSAFIGEQTGFKDILSFDMGGTTAKGAIIRGAKPLKRYRLEVAREHEFRAGSGLPLQIPAIDMIEIGAGGGSLAAVDERGLLAVGPNSAGANPGPASYGNGGTEPTLTDANTVLGYLVPERFLDGKMPLDMSLATKAIETGVAKPLDIGVARAAWGIHEVINEDVARAFRMHASEIGFDYRDCTMIAFGGSGPVHALRVARKLGIPRVIFPPAAGVMSAVGMLVTPLSFETVRTVRVGLNAIDDAFVTTQLDDLSRIARDFFAAAGVDDHDVTVSHRLDMRYVGQGHEIEVAVPQALSGQSLVDALPELFHQRYREVFSAVTLSQPLEIVNWKVEARGPQPAVSRDYGKGFAQQGEAVLQHYPVYWGDSDAFTDCPVISRYRLKPGETVTGPALLLEAESTCVVGIDEQVYVDPELNLIAELA